MLVFSCVPLPYQGKELSRLSVCSRGEWFELNERPLCVKGAPRSGGGLFLLSDLRIYNPSASFLGISLYTREALNLNRLSIPRRGEWSISLLQWEKVAAKPTDEVSM